MVVDLYIDFVVDLDIDIELVLHNSNFVCGK